MTLSRICLCVMIFTGRTWIHLLRPWQQWNCSWQLHCGGQWHRPEEAECSPDGVHPGYSCQRRASIYYSQQGPQGECSLKSIFKLFASRSGTIADCQTVFKLPWLASWMGETMFAMRRGVQRELAAQNWHHHTLWRCLGLVRKSVMVLGC